MDPVPEGPNESSLARSAWKQDKSRPVPEGRLICLTSPRDIFLRTLRRALLETPNAFLEKFESDDVRPDGGCNRSFLATEKRSHSVARMRLPLIPLAEFKKKAKCAPCSESLRTGLLCNQYNPECAGKSAIGDLGQVPRLLETKNNR